MRYRLAAFVLAPLVGLQRRVFASRESLADRMSLEDRRSSEELLSWTPGLGAFEHCFLGARDARLVECLRHELDRTGNEEDRLAVVYGARHMRAVLVELNRRGFYVADSAWRTVFAA